VNEFHNIKITIGILNKSEMYAKKE